MRAFYLAWPADRILQTLSAKSPIADKGAAEAHYALEGLPSKALAAEYQTVLPDEKLLAKELTNTRRELEARRIGCLSSESK